MIGHSLSFCILDIIRDKVAIQSIEKIYTSTKCSTDVQWDDMIGCYSRVYWMENLADALRAVHILTEAGKIEQPRLTNPAYAYSIDNGYWG